MNKKIIALSLTFCMVVFSVLNFSAKENVYAGDYILASYTTVFGEWDKPRTNNIKLSTNAINNLVIKSGETFSFNDVVGERTIENGYQESIVLVYDKKVKGVGGGICQVSSTLYNSALNSNMEILERHEHLGDIYYVPEGQDATVSYPELDFKFRNNYDFDIYIRAYTYGNRLTVEIVKL